MARAARFVFRILLVGLLSGGAYFAWISSVGSPAAIDVLPPGAFAVVAVRDAEELSQRLAGTRFAAAFARSAIREWLERTAAVQAFDSVLAEVERISGVSPGRGSAFDLLGADAAVGWYPPAGGDAVDAPWVAGGRLSARAWVAATAMRLARHLGLGAMSVTREEVAGRVLYSLHGGAGESLHVFLAGRVLVGGPDRSLVVQAARAAGDPAAAMTREPAWQSLRGALPANGEILVWLRDRNAIPGVPGAGSASRGGVGALLRAGKRIEIDIAAEPAAARPADRAASAAQPLPGMTLPSQAPLFFLSGRGPAPSALVDLLQTRRTAVTRRSAGAVEARTAIQPGSGYAVVITDSAGGSGLFPTPRGLVAIGMASAAEAGRVLPLLFPPGARTTTSSGTFALATRESIPLAGEFELWGAAIGPQLVFATSSALVAAAAADAGAGTTRGPDDPAWPVDIVAGVSMEKALPLLQRWRAPLSGLAAANWPEAPDVTRDLELLGAIGSVRFAAGADDRFDRAAVRINVHDLR